MFKIQSSNFLYRERNYPTVKYFMKNKPKCAMFLVLPCRVMNHFEDMLKAIATLKKCKNKDSQKSHLKIKISANVFTLEIQAMKFRDKNTTL